MQKGVIDMKETEAERWKLVEEHAEFLYASAQSATRQEARMQAIRKFFTADEIAKLGSLYDVELKDM